MTSPYEIVYFSSVSENTHRFVQRAAKQGNLTLRRIPLRRTDTPLRVTNPYLLVTPTYGADDRAGAVPRQVIGFLNDPGNRSLLRGVVSGGNTNFAQDYAIAGDTIARKTGAPLLMRFELLGLPEDVAALIDLAHRAPPQRTSLP